MSDDLTRVVIVGHVDHGKSTFIGRLLFDTGNLAPDRMAEIKKASEEQGRRLEFAYVTDQFAEEREQNITIDTSQTFLKTNGRHFLIIDAPGHKEYLKNMITGATQARNGIIMLDINEGVREQTEKHARILKLLGIDRIAVLVNKMDLKEYSEQVFRRCEEELARLMSDWGISADNIIPISAYEGDNVASRSPRMPWYRGPCALDFLMACDAGDSANPGRRPLRLPVQLLFEKDGRRWVLGRVEQGSVSVGQNVTVFPGGGERPVADILKFESRVPSAGEGECVAVGFDDSQGLLRGQVLTDQKGATVADRVVAHAFWAAADPLKVGDVVTVECRTQSAPFTVETIFDGIEQREVEQLGSGDVGQVTLKAGGPILIDQAVGGSVLSRLVFHVRGEVAGCGVASHVE